MARTRKFNTRKRKLLMCSNFNRVIKSEKKLNDIGLEL